VHALPALRDDAGDLVADDGRQRRGVRIHADARHQVGEVHARGVHVDRDLAGSGLRVGPVLHLQDVGRPLAGDHDCAHGVRG
jgi:hypothetical protein